MIEQFMVPTKSDESGSGQQQFYLIETWIGYNTFNGLFDK